MLNKIFYATALVGFAVSFAFPVSAQEGRGAWITAGGFAQESDKDQARQESHDMAVDSLNRRCSGVMDTDTIEETGTRYSNVGIGGNDVWAVVVTVKGFCKH